MNGLNGGAGAQMGGGLGGGTMGNIPAPAGYSAELSYIHAMVEELSRQLAENKRVLDDVVTGVGRVRSRAVTQQLGNAELVAGAVGEDLQKQERNMDEAISVLSEALEAAKYAKEANATLAAQYAGAMADMLKQFHAYKQRHVADVAAWHRSYRHQLAEARAENSRLRDQIWDLQHHAGTANALLRDFRRRYDEDPARWERRVQDRAMRQELRFWKRMAMPGLPDDDAEAWSDDDDLVDPAEKIRLRDLEKKATEERLQQQRLQQQIQQQQQQRLQFQQQHYDPQAAAAGTAESTTAAAVSDPEGVPVDNLSLDDLSRAAAAAGDPEDSMETGDNAYEDDDDDDDDEEDDDEAAAAAREPGHETAATAQGQEDEDMDLEADLPPHLPAVPQAPSSAPTPLSISRMGTSGERIECIDGETVHDEGLTVPALPPRPSSAGSTGSSGF